MSNVKTYCVIAFMSSAMLAACESTPKSNASKMGMLVPDWILNPTVDKGLAASSCVKASNSFSIDKSQAATQARVELSKQLETRIANLQEEYSSKIAAMGNTNTESKITITTTQLTNQYIRGSKVTKVDYAQINTVKNLCTMVVLPEDKTKALYAALLKQTPIKLDPENETLLYLNFLKSENVAN